MKLKLTFNNALFVILVLLFISISSLNIVFLSFDYLVHIMLRNIVEVGMMALAATLIIITGGIDLSVGSILVLSAMAGGTMTGYTPPMNYPGPYGYNDPVYGPNNYNNWGSNYNPNTAGQDRYWRTRNGFYNSSNGYGNGGSVNVLYD